MQMKFGPAGLGGAKEAISNLEKFHKLGLKACEVAFTYSVYLKENDAKEIGKAAARLGIDLTCHAQYYINLNSKEKAKIEASKKRILQACKIAHFLGAKYVVFHAAFYHDSAPEDCYQIVKQAILELQAEIKKNKWNQNLELAPETTGKKSQFGTLQELLQLAKETNCFLCIDFAHLKARANGKIDYDEIFKTIKQDLSKIHCHFSGIVYGEKGEKNHIKTNPKDIKELLEFFKKYNISGTIINESPDLVNDSIKSLEIWNSLR